jgi:hypothetical protein
VYDVPWRRRGQIWRLYAADPALVRSPLVRHATTYEFFYGCRSPVSVAVV